MNSVTMSQERIQKIIRERIPESNMIVAKVLIAFSIISIAISLLFRVGFLSSKGILVTVALNVTPVVFILAASLCIIRKGKGAAFQYIFLVLLAIFWLELEIMSGYKSRLLLPLLIILSLRYYNKKYTIFTYITCLFVLLLSIYCNAYLYAETEFLDLNIVYLTQPHTTTLSGFIYNNIIDLKPSAVALLHNGFRLNFLPNAIFLSALTVLSLRFMRHNLKNIIKVNEMEMKEANSQIQIADMKTKLLLSQIQPHFIYNTLTTISYFCDEDPKKAEELTNRFSEYLQSNLRDLTDSREVGFSKELEAIRNYLEIEKFRFGERIKVEYDIQDVDFSVPVLTLQPIVENAVKHGICKKKKGGTIWISTYEEENYHVVKIRDDGVGFDMKEVERDGKDHVGIRNVTERIRYAGGEIEILSQLNEGTTAVIHLPKEANL